jgi:hypothetical protein
VTRRLMSVVLAASGLAGTGVVAFPEHAASIASLAVATVAVVTAGFLLVVVGALACTRPEPWPATEPGGRTVTPLDPQGLRDARRVVASRLAAGADVRLVEHPDDPGGLR